MPRVAGLRRGSALTGLNTSLVMVRVCCHLKLLMTFAVNAVCLLDTSDHVFADILPLLAQVRV